MKLHQIPLDEACAVRWRRGRAERGLADKDPFQGDPAAEAYEELVDLATYLRLAGFEDLRSEVAGIAAELALRIAKREIHAPRVQETANHHRPGCG